MTNFIEKIAAQLQIMTETEKDEWILSLAKTASEERQENLYKSICGTKKIMYMPEPAEIDAFCEKIENGEIVIEYEAHYVEFDEFGHYYNDWEQEYYDFGGAMGFVASVIHGCHDLVILEEYSLAHDTLKKVMDLKFEIVDSEETEDICEEEYFSLQDAVKRGMLSVNPSEVLYDYILCCRNTANSANAACRQIASAVQMELFENCKPGEFLGKFEDKSFLNALYHELNEALAPLEAEYLEMQKMDIFNENRYRIGKKIEPLKEILNYLQEKNAENAEGKFLQGAWSQMMGLISELKLEPYIDDQIEINQIWDIAEALIKRGRFDEEPWAVKEEIIIEMLECEFFDEFGACDPMKDLMHAMCVSGEEKRQCAELLMRTGSYFSQKEAAKLYKELGETEKYISFYEKNFGKTAKPYQIVADYYKDKDIQKTLEVSRLAIEKCREDLTQFFIYLLEDARDRGDEESFQKLMKSARRRGNVSTGTIEEKFF